MFTKTLPIGSVVLLKNANKRIMILGYCRYSADDTSKVYDYCGCTYPEGFLSPEKTIVFDHEQIEHIYALGFQDEEQFEFKENLTRILEKRARETK